ncbi:MAG: PAP/fibrillin family protein [Steroidobacteraceae bacterium]|jgi:hypothetical protein|nr:PAP/fibrillin family protein [Steroidobacteraceae bacterium]
MLKDELMALVDSQDANGGFSDEVFARLGELVEAIRAESPWPEPTRTLERIEGRWETVFAHFGGKVNAGKTRIHDSTLALQSWNRFPAVPIRVQRICQEIARRGNAYNNVIDFTAADGRTQGAVVVRGTFRDDPGNAQRFHVEFTRMEVVPAPGGSEAGLRAALGLTAGEPLVAEMKPPRVSSDVVYLDDQMRINLGSLGGMYLLRRSPEPPVSVDLG